MPLAIINDITINRKTKVFFSTDDFALADKVWNNTDPVLEELQNTTLFKGRTRWSDLRPLNYRVMISRNIQKLSKLTPEQQTDPDNDVVTSLYFLICCFIRFIERSSESEVELLQMTYSGNFDLGTLVTMNMRTDDPSRMTKKAGIAVVVDNTKEE